MLDYGFLQVVFFFWVIGDRCGVWVIGVGLWCLVFDGLGFFFFG